MQRLADLAHAATACIAVYAQSSIHHKELQLAVDDPVSGKVAF